MKKILILPLSLVLLIIIVFILAGTPLVLNFAKSKITSIIQSQIGIPVSIGSLQGNLLYKTRIYNLKIGEVAEIESISVSYNIFALLSKRIEINYLLIDGISVDVNKATELTNNLKPEAREKTKETRTPFQISIKRLEINNVHIGGLINKKKLTMSLDLRGLLVNQVFIVDYFYLQTKNSYVSVKGNIPLNDNNHYAIRYSLHIVPEEFGIEGLSGIIQSKGDIKGSYQNPELANITEIKMYYLKNHISGRIEIGWKVPFFDSLDINAAIAAQIESQGNFQIVLKKKFTNFFAGIESPYGNLRIPGVVSGSFENPEFKGRIQGGLKYAQIKPKLSGEIAYQDSVLSISNLKLRNKDISLQFSGRINPIKSEIITANMNIKCADLNMINEFLKQPIPVHGPLNMNAQARGRFDNPNISARLVVENVRVYNEIINNADFDFNFKNNIVYLENGLVKTPRGEIRIAGNVGLKDNSFAGSIFTENIKFESPEVFGKDTVPLSGNLKMDISVSGNISRISGKGTINFTNFSYDKYTFENCFLEFDIKNNCADIAFFDINNNLNLKTSIQLVEPYPFNVCLFLNHFEFAQFTELEKAFVSGKISAKGEMTRPEMTEVNIQIDSVFIVAQKYLIQNFEPMNIEIKNGIAHFHNAIIAFENHKVSIQGQVPIDKKYGEINLKIQADHIELGSLCAIFSKGLIPEGFLDADVAITGNLNAPEINGELTLEKIGYALPDLMIESVSGLVKFQKDYFNIEYINGKVNNGAFEINGYVQMDKSGIDTVAIKMLLKEIDYVNKEFGSIVISSSMQFSANSSSYVLNGKMTLDQAVYDKPFDLMAITRLLTTANRPAQEQNKILKQISCDMSISTPNSMKIINNIADVSVDADLQIKGPLSRINIYGTVKTSSPGTIKYLGRKFDITNALIEFDNPYQINPALNLEAIHSVSSRDGDYEITMNLSGTIEKWYLQLSSNPPIPEQDIISLLLIGRRRPGLYLIAEAKDIDLKGAAKDYALGLARGTLERTAEKSLGFEKFTITGDLLEPRQWDIGFEKRISKKIVFIYGTGIESWEMRRIGMNYSINNNISIFTLHDQENMNSSVDLEFNFKIK